MRKGEKESGRERRRAGGERGREREGRKNEGEKGQERNREDMS